MASRPTLYLSLLVACALILFANGYAGYVEWKNFPTSDLKKLDEMHRSGMLGNCSVRTRFTDLEGSADLDACIANFTRVSTNFDAQFAKLTYECSSENLYGRIYYLIYRDDGILHCSYSLSREYGSLETFNDQSIAANPNRPGIFLQFFISILGD